MAKLNVGFGLTTLFAINVKFLAFNPVRLACDLYDLRMVDQSIDNSICKGVITKDIAPSR